MSDISVHHVLLYLSLFLLHMLEAFVNICLKPDELKAQHSSVSWLLCLSLKWLRHSATVAAAVPAATPCLPGAPLDH